jgi:hypothetical protein
MLAEAGDIDVTNQDHFVMVLSKDSIIDHVCVGRNCLSVFGGGNGCTREGKKKLGVAERTCLADAPRSLSSSTSGPGRIVLVCEEGLLDRGPRRYTRGLCAPRRRVSFGGPHFQRAMH